MGSSHLYAHIVLTTKYRRRVMTDRVTAELKAAFTEVCTRFDVTLDAFETDQDHAHLLVSYPPKVALSRLVMSLKAISSQRVRQHKAGTPRSPRMIDKHYGANTSGPQATAQYPAAEHP